MCVGVPVEPILTPHCINTARSEQISICSIGIGLHFEAIEVVASGCVRVGFGHAPGAGEDIGYDGFDDGGSHSLGQCRSRRSFGGCRDSGSHQNGEDAQSGVDHFVLRGVVARHAIVLETVLRQIVNVIECH